MIEQPCSYYERLISDAADGPLEPELQEELERHLASCAECRKFQESLTVTSSSLRRLPVVEMKGDLRHGRAETRGTGPLQRIWRTRVSLPAPVAVAALIVIVGLSVWVAGRFAKAQPTQIVQPSASINYVQVEQIPLDAGTPIAAKKKP